MTDAAVKAGHIGPKHVPEHGPGSSELPLKPPVTVDDLRKAIPEHCWVRDNKTSFTYLGKNLAVVAALAIVATFFDWFLENSLLRFVMWTAYVLAQGWYCTGLWVLAHEAGHRAFSESDLINDTVGMLVHSALLVPYHSWRISHASHHFNTNNMEKDEVHIPNRFSDVKEKLPWSSSQTLYSIIKHLVLGWPAYLLWNASSNRNYKGHVDHFNPQSPLFKPEQAWQIVLSDTILAIWVFFLGYCAYNYGVWYMIKLYFFPYLHVNVWLVLITKLQHTDPDVPHYGPKEWTWLQGQLCTIDRSFGFLDTIFHHISDTHVVHHLFSKIPHYHAAECTEIIRKMLGPYYKRNEDNVFKQTWDVFTHCVFVDDDAEVYWFYPQADVAKVKAN